MFEKQKEKKQAWMFPLPAHFSSFLLQQLQ